MFKRVTILRYLMVRPGKPLEHSCYLNDELSDGASGAPKYSNIQTVSFLMLLLEHPSTVIYPFVNNYACACVEESTLSVSPCIFMLFKINAYALEQACPKDFLKIICSTQYMYLRNAHTNWKCR